MQTEATGSHSAIADGSSLHSMLPLSAMAGFGLPPSLGDDMISFTGGRIPSCFADDYWGPQATGKDAMVGLTPSVRDSPYLFESPKSVVDSTDYSYGGGAAAFPAMNEWMLTEQERFNPGPSRFSKKLSLSLASSHAPHPQCSELSSSGSNNLSLNFSSSKPFPAAAPQSGSRFFRAMQEILAEFACYALENLDHSSFASASRGLSLSSSSTNAFCDGHDRLVIHSNGKEHLLSLLQLVDDQYNQCLDEIHTIVSAFHVVTELDPNLHARFALPAISYMYRNLRERISSHILAMGARQSEGDAREETSFETSFIQKQWALQQLKKRDHQLWRPQRGLPERSVSVLRAWMFQNFLHPYPKDAEKHLLALKSGLTRSQVSNWFINARVRLWKPMIEEMYAEMNRRKARRNEEEGNGSSHRSQLSRRFAVE